MTKSALVCTLFTIGVLLEPSLVPQSLAQATKPAKSTGNSQTQYSSNAGPCKDTRLTRVTLSPNSSGEIVEGPACVEASPVNTLRNFIFISTASTQTAGPSPASIFPSSADKIPSSGDKPKTLSERVSTARQILRKRLDDNRTATAKLEDLIARLREFVVHSDESVGGGHFDTLVAQMKDRKIEIDQALQNRISGWTVTDDILKHVHSLQNEWLSLPVEHPEEMADAASKTTYEALKGQLDDLETKALLQASGSDAAKAVGKNMGLLTYWSNVLGSFLEPDGSLPSDPAAKFVVHQDVPCRALFNMNKSTAVKLSVGDRVPFFDGQQMSTQTHDAFVTVNCTSPISLSAGVEFSFIQQREFAIVQSPTSPGATTTVNKFGYSSLSTVHPLPLAMAHLRFHEWDGHRYALHATFGVGANVQGANAGGSSAEYLTGLSFSLFRAMYLTAGVDFGKQASLSGGFHVGDTVPSGITSPPIQTSFKAGAGFAITFTKP